MEFVNREIHNSIRLYFDNKFYKISSKIKVGMGLFFFSTNEMPLRQNLPGRHTFISKKAKYSLTVDPERVEKESYNVKTNISSNPIWATNKMAHIHFFFFNTNANRSESLQHNSIESTYKLDVLIDWISISVDYFGAIWSESFSNEN